MSGGIQKLTSMKFFKNPPKSNKRPLEVGNDTQKRVEKQPKIVFTLSSDDEPVEIVIGIVKQAAPVSTNKTTAETSGKTTQTIDKPKDMLMSNTVPAEPPATQMHLTPEQNHVVDLVINQRKNIFFTGNAGTGKSVVTKEIIRQILLTRSAKRVAITATTGLAGVNIGGGTLHSWAGIGLGTGEIAALIKRIQLNKQSLSRWTETEVLFIDEVSMLDAALFDTLEHIARVVRKSQKPFGGIQVVCCGDFLQLPPIGNRDPNDFNKYVEAKFCFDSNSWPSVIQETVILRKVFRQRDDDFVTVLNEIRLGTLSNMAIQAIRYLDRIPNFPDDGILPTVLHAKRKDVEMHNQSQLNKLPGEVRRYVAQDWKEPDFHTINLDTTTAIPQEVVLKAQAQVILLKNMGAEHRGLVNGSRGVILHFEAEAGGSEMLPVVRFSDGTELLLTRQDFTVELNGKTVASRKQVPLALAWSLTVHKSQGQTIDRLEVNLGDIFEKGQAYVALSRARDPKFLRVRGFNPHRVKAHERALWFEKRLGK